LRLIICQNARNWIKNPLANSWRGFGQLIFQSICQEFFIQFWADILWASNGHSYGHSYQKLNSFEVKKKFQKKAFRHHEWRDPPRGQCLTISTGEFYQLFVNFIDKFPFRYKFLKWTCFGQFAIRTHPLGSCLASALLPPTGLFPKHAIMML